MFNTFKKWCSKKIGRYYFDDLVVTDGMNFNTLVAVVFPTGAFRMVHARAFSNCSVSSTSNQHN